MGSSISALLIISVLLTSVVVMFRANQIGMDLLAGANRSAAQYRAEVVDSDFALTSEITTLDSFNAEDEAGCKPIYEGVTRTGEITPANLYDCYWFDANTIANTKFKVNYMRNVGSDVGRENYGDLDFVGFSLEHYRPGDAITPWNWGSAYKDLITVTGDHEFNVTTSSTDISKHRLKIWYYRFTKNQIEWDPDWPDAKKYRGEYQITLSNIGGVDLMNLQCVDKFRFKNMGRTTFPIEAAYFLDAIDIFVKLIAMDGTETMTKLIRSDDLILAGNEWHISLPDSISVEGDMQPNDVYEPSVFNKNEIAEVTVKINGYANESGTVVIIWPNGIKSAENFSSLCNN